MRPSDKLQNRQEQDSNSGPVPALVSDRVAMDMDAYAQFFQGHFLCFFLSHRMDQRENLDLVRRQKGL